MNFNQKLAELSQGSEFLGNDFWNCEQHMESAHQRSQIRQGAPGSQVFGDSQREIYTTLFSVVEWGSQEKPGRNGEATTVFSASKTNRNEECTTPYPNLLKLNIPWPQFWDTLTSPYKDINFSYGSVWWVNSRLTVPPGSLKDGITGGPEMAQFWWPSLS